MTEMEQKKPSLLVEIWMATRKKAINWIATGIFLSVLALIYSYIAMPADVKACKKAIAEHEWKISNLIKADSIINKKIDEKVTKEELHAAYNSITEIKTNTSETNKRIDEIFIVLSKK